MDYPRNGALEYIALGDSLTVGAGVPLFDSSFVEYYSQQAEVDLGKPVDIYKYARVGATTKEVLYLLHSKNVYRNPLSKLISLP